MAKTDKPPKKKARLAAIEARLVELQETLRALDHKLDAPAHPHAPKEAHGADAPQHTHAELNERLARLETKLDTLIAGLAQVEAGPALRGETTPDSDEGEGLES